MDSETNPKRFSILCVGDIRKAIQGLPDDRIVAAQVVAADGTAWSMRAVFVPCVPNGDIALIDLRHPDLKTLPKD